MPSVRRYWTAITKGSTTTPTPGCPPDHSTTTTMAGKAIRNSARLVATVDRGRTAEGNPGRRTSSLLPVIAVDAITNDDWNQVQTSTPIETNAEYLLIRVGSTTVQTKLN